MLRFFKNQDIEELPKEVAHVEIDPNKKPPKQIPVLKIILSVFFLGFLIAVIVTGIALLAKQDNYKKTTDAAKTNLEARVKNYPKPLPNTCDEEIKICGSGIVTGKNEKTCKFEACPEFASDMTKFWNVEAKENYLRIYINLDLNYEFELLKTWDFVGLDYGFILYSPNYDCGKEVKPKGSVCDGTIIEMLSSNTTAETDIGKWYESGENHLLRNSDNPPPKTIEYTEINGIKTLKTENTINTDNYYFIYKNNVYILRISSAGDLDKALAKPHIERLLNSFMFFDN